MTIFDELSNEQLAAAADENLATHMSWLQRHTPGMQVFADEQLVVVDCGLPTDTFNTVCRARLVENTMRERILRVATHFAMVQRPFAWWVGPSDQPADLGEALAQAGFRQVESAVAMAADLRTLHPTDLAPQGLRIERATTAQQIGDFAALLVPLWTPPDEFVRQYYEATTPALLSADAPIHLYVGYLGDTPVATAELTIGGDAAGLYSVVTVEAHRRKGIGGAMTLRPLLDAREMGLKIGVLQASPEGERVYARIGFRPTGLYREYQIRAN
jgi:hypothetical protein